MSNSSEILAILEYMEKEKQISRQDMIESIAAAIKNAASKSAHAGYDLKIDINPKSGALKSWALLTVSDSVADPATQIHIDKAKLIKPDAQIGDVIESQFKTAYNPNLGAAMSLVLMILIFICVAVMNRFGEGDGEEVIKV